MDLKGGSSYDSVTTVQSIGKDWGRLPHREPFYTKRLRERRKEHQGYRSFEAPDEDKTSSGEKQNDGAGQKSHHGEGFEVTV
jgi:hypothetical protein